MCAKYLRLSADKGRLNSFHPEMSFVGMDPRAPGDRWIRTDFGWRRLADSHNCLSAQFVYQLHSLSSSSPTSLSRTNSGTGERSSSAASPDQCISAKNEKQVKELKFLLSQRCISARTSSRESNHYSTISDAVNKLNFIQALNDDSCFPFVCKVVTLLYKQQYWSLSGSMHTMLLRTAEAAKETAMETRKHTGLVTKLIENAIAALEKGRKNQFGFATRSTDTKIKSLLKMKRQLRDELQEYHHHHRGLGSLPEDCLRHIISYLSEPRDVVNLGQTCLKLYYLTEESLVWRDLTAYHYRLDILKIQPTVIADVAPVYAEDLTTADHRNRGNQPEHWKDVFIQEYKLSKGKLRAETSDAVCLCKSCNFIYWKSYGHPCCAGSTVATKKTTRRLLEPETRQWQRLTAEQFLSYFVS